MSAFRAESASRRRRLATARGARDDRVEGEAERDDERRPPELSHLEVAGLAAVYFDGHFVTIVPGVATKVPLLELPVDDDVAARREEVGHAARVDDRDGRAVGSLTSRSRNRSPAPCASPVGLPTTRPTSETVPVCRASSLGLTDGVPPPAIEV